MPRNSEASTALATYRRLVPSQLRRRIAAKIPPVLRARLTHSRQPSPARRPHSDVGVLHASVDGGDTLNIAVAAAADWVDPVLVLRRAELNVELPTMISTDLGGLRRAESSVRLCAEPGQASALPVVVVDPGAWRIELLDRVGGSSVTLVCDLHRDPARSPGAMWSITVAPGDAVVVEAMSVKPYPRVETIAIGFTSIEVSGTLVGSWDSPLSFVVRLRGEELQLQAITTREDERFHVSLPLEAMIGHDGVWECHLQGSDEKRRAVTRHSGESDRRFDVETPVRLVAASDGRLVRVRGYTTKSGGFRLSTTTINEESS